MVGQTGRRQSITLGRGCLHAGIVAHEIGQWFRQCKNTWAFGASILN